MIHSVQFASNRNTQIKNNIEIALPLKDRGSITVICGKNHSGKTYITKRIHRSIFQRNEAIKKDLSSEIYRFGVNNIYVEYTEPNTIINSILISRIELITDLIKGASVITNNNHKNRKYLQQSDNIVRIEIKETLIHFCYDCFNNYCKNNSKSINKVEWFNPNNIQYRSDFLNMISFNRLFLTPRDNPVVKIFEELTGGKLYFGVNERVEAEFGNFPEFELRLAFNGDVIIPSGGWSEGQKVLFSLLLLIYYIRPDILIFDEIENHLHPEYISIVLDFIKKYVKQSIITTHHPHIIFSKHVDIVNYLEFTKTSDELTEIIEKKNGNRMKSMILKNELLLKNYSKLLSTYKLFDSYDNQLLRISSSSISDLNDVLINVFTNLFNYEIISPQKNKNPDIQSQKLYDIFANKLHESNISILEFGAGEGRLLIDIEKILRSPEKGKICWNLYEPFAEPREKLIKNMIDYPYEELIKIHSNKPDSKFDFIIIPNLLHELNPKTIAGILSYCSQSLKRDGSIVIVELFPLLKPEKYAVPLRGIEWTNLARKIGFKAKTSSINFKNAIHEAYFTQLFVQNHKPISAENSIESIICEFWCNEILPERTNSYDGCLKFGDIDEIPTTIGNLCTIASINAYNIKIWDT